MISVTSSFTPLIVENSWSTPLILIPTAAAPGKDAKSIRLKLFPIVIPNPRSSGSTVNWAYAFLRFRLMIFLVF